MLVYLNALPPADLGPWLPWRMYVARQAALNAPPITAYEPPAALTAVAAAPMELAA